MPGEGEGERERERDARAGFVACLVFDIQEGQKWAIAFGRFGCVII